MKLKKILMLIAMFIITITSFSATVIIENQPAHPVELGKSYNIEWLVLMDESESLTSTTLKFKNDSGVYEDVKNITSQSSSYTYQGTNETIIPKKQFYKIEAVTDGGTFYSMESYIVLQANTSITYREPLGTITNTTPEFSWDAVAGAAGYKLIFSASPITITTNEEDEPEVEGGNIIWQVSTSKTNLYYGESGDLGTEVGNPAPLAFDQSGIAEYYYIIMVMYGESEGSISTTIPSSSDIEKIKLEGYPTIDPTNLLTPENTEIISDDYINLSWEAVSGANLYHLYIEEKVDMQGINTRALAYDEIVNGTQIELNAKTTLKGATYYWYVMTEGNDGNVAKSEEREFTYEIPSTTVKGKVKDSKGALISGVEVYLKTESGTKINVVPYITEDNGAFEVENVKSGNYYVEAILEGYTQTSINEILIPSNPESTVSISDVILTAKDSSFTGIVNDSNGNCLKQVVVAAKNYEGEEYSTVTDENGYFILKIEAGIWNIKYKVDGYSEKELINQLVNPGNTNDLGIIYLNENSVTVTGTVYNDDNEKLQGATLILTNGEVSYEKQSLFDGGFNFNIQPGEWTLKAEKLGFAPSDEKIYRLGVNENVIGEAITLIGNATIITGKVLDNYGRGVVSANVRFEGTKTYEIETDLYGKYSVSVKKGDYIVNVLKNGYSQVNDISQSVGYGESVSLNINMLANSSEITGIVFDERGLPLSGVEIITNMANTYTNSNGEYTLSLKDGEYNVTAKKDGYNSSGKVVTLGVGQELEGINFNLSQDIVNISGTVKDKNTGEVLSNVKVSIGVIETYTDNYGRYELDLQPGIYSMNFSKTNYSENEFTSIKLQSGYNISGKDVTLEKNIAYILGRVTSGGIPLREATVSIGDITVVTNSEGNYKVPMGAGNYKVEAQKRGYSTEIIESVILSNDDLGTDKIVSTMELQLLPVTIEGTVVDGNGTPKSNVKVMATAGEISSNAVTDANGEFRLGVQPGSVTLITEYYGYSSINQLITVSDNISDLILEINDERGTLKGTITNGANSVIKLEDKVIYIDSNEEYLVKLASGSYNLEISKAGYKTVTSSINIIENKVTTKDITLEKETGKLNISVNESGAKVYINGPENMNKILTGTEWNNIELPYGDYSVSVMKENYSTDMELVTINNATSKTINAVINSLGGTIKGQVSPRDALIILRKDSNEIWRGYADEFGAYETPKLESGSYTIEAQKDGYETKEITANAGDIQKDILLTVYTGEVVINIDEIIKGNVVLKESGNVVKTINFDSNKVILRKIDTNKTYTLEVTSLEEDVVIDEVGVLTEFIDNKATANVAVTRLNTNIKLELTDGTNKIANVLVTLRELIKNDFKGKIIKVKQSDMNGIVEFVNLKSGMYEIEIQKSGYERQENLVYTSIENFETQEVVMNSNTTNTVVTNITPGAAIKLYLGNVVYSEIASETGEAIFNNVPKGEEGILKISKENYVSKIISVKVADGKLTNLNDTDLIDLTLSEEGVLRGTITNGASAIVSIDGKSVYADSNGVYEIKGLGVGTKTLKISKFGYSDVESSKKIDIGENTFNASLIKLESDITITIKKADGSGISDVSIELNGIIKATNNSGVVVFSDLKYAENGTDYEITITKGNVVKKDIIIVNEDSESYTYELELKEAQITGGIGQNGIGATVKVMDENGVIVETLNLSKDSSTFDTGKVLGKGTYKLIIQKLGFNSVVKEVTLDSNDDVKNILPEEINLISSYFIITGTVSSENKLNDVQVNLKDSRKNTVAEVYTGGDGMYKIQSEFVSGDYTLEFKKDGYIKSETEEFTISETDFEKVVNGVLIKSEDTIAPEIINKTEDDVYKKGDTIGFKAIVTDNITASAISVKVVGNLNGEEFEYVMTESEGEYKKGYKISEAGRLEYQIEAFDGANTAISEKQIINILGELAYTKVEPNQVTMMKESEYTLNLKSYDKYGNELAIDEEINWNVIEGENIIKIVTESGISLTSSSITISSTTGTGIARIEATYSGLTSEIEVKVKEVSLENVFLLLDFTASQVKAGTEIEYSLTVAPKDGAAFKVIPDLVKANSTIVEIDEEKQKIKTKEGKVGKVEITAYYKNKVVSKILEIYEVIGVEGGKIVNPNGVILEIADNSVSKNETIGIYKSTAPALPEGDLDITGNVYRITPENLILAENARLTLPIPSEIDLKEYGVDSIDIYWWNGIEWEMSELNKTVSTRGISIDVIKLGTYAVLVRSESLKIKEFEIYPNPFRPKNGGTLVKYKITSSEQTMLYITIKVFTERGRLIRTLADNEMIEKLERCYMKWDGKDNYGEVVKSGRYVIRLEAEDISGEVTENKTVVVIK